MAGWDETMWRRLVFRLCYHQHGGSGLNFTLGDVEDMLICDAYAYVELLDEQREEEARELRKASKAR